MSHEVEVNISQIEEYLQKMLLIAKKMRTIMFDTAQSLQNEDEIEFENNIIARDIEIEKYDLVKISYENLLNELELKFKKTEFEILKKYELQNYKDQIKDIFELILEKDREHIQIAEKLIKSSKNEIKKMKVSKRATSSYYGVNDYSSGGRFDNKR